MCIYVPVCVCVRACVCLCTRSRVHSHASTCLCIFCVRSFYCKQKEQYLSTFVVSPTPMYIACHWNETPLCALSWQRHSWCFLVHPCALCLLYKCGFCSKIFHHQISERDALLRQIISGLDVRKCIDCWLEVMWLVWLQWFCALVSWGIWPWKNNASAISCLFEWRNGLFWLRWSAVTRTECL